MPLTPHDNEPITDIRNEFGVIDGIKSFGAFVVLATIGAGIAALETAKKAINPAKYKPITEQSDAN